MGIISKGWDKLALQRKLQILIQGFLLLILISAQQWISIQFEQQTLNSAQERANTIADGAINGLNTLMVTKSGQDEIISNKVSRALFIKKMGASEGIKEMRIIRGKGVNDEHDAGLPQEQAVDDMDRLVLNGGKTESKIVRNGEETSLRTVVPFIASKNFRTTDCLKCHGVDEGAVLGAASVTIDIKEYISKIKKVNILIWIGQVILQIVLFFVIGQLIRRRIGIPINMMQSILSEVERTGDYSKQMDSHSADEIGQTAAAFNSMMTSLQEALSNTNTVMGSVAAGDFSKRVTVETRGDLALLKQSVNSSVDTLHLTMSALIEVLKALCEGDFAKRVNVKAQGEFKLAIDQASQAMETMQTLLGDVGNVMVGVAQGNLTGRVNANGYGDLAKLKEAINTSLQGLSGAMKTINDNTRQVAISANQSSSAIGQISDGAQNQMHAIDQLATAMRQTVRSVSDVSNNTEAASHQAQESVKIVRDGKIKMERMVDVVHSIASNSEKINKITEVIEGIANKTNLLSLNAAIEAARACEHGKGFAVVAEEVGKLAANSASSTHEIATLVQQAVADASRAVASVKEVAGDMDRIESGSMETDGMLRRISVALEQQSAAVQEINASVENLNKIGQSNASASEEITATVVELSKIADNTRREVEKFTV